MCGDLVVRPCFDLMDGHFSSSTRFRVVSRDKKFRALSICQNCLARLVSSQTDCTDLKDKFYPSPSNFFKIAPTIFGLIIFQDCTGFYSTIPSYLTYLILIQSGWSGRPVLAN